VFGISGTELFIIALFAIIVFGPDKLPALGRTVGRFMKEFKKVQDDVETMIKKEMAMVDDQAKDESAAPGGAPAPEIPVITQTSLADDADEEEEEEE
jgi:sec-independent protein translocase protein TatB